MNKYPVRTIKASVYLRLTRLTLVDTISDKDYILSWSYKNNYFTVAVTDKSTNKIIQNTKVVMNETILLTLLKFMRKVRESKEEVSYSLLSKGIDFDNKDNKSLLNRGKITIGKKKVGEACFFNY